MIYLDNAATTFKKPEKVIETVTYAMSSYTNSGRGAYKLSLNSGRMIYETRVKLSRFFGSREPSKVIFTSNATEGLNTVLFGLLHGGDHIVGTVTEHNSVLRPLYKLNKDRGVEYDFVGIDGRGRLRPCDFEKYIRKETKAIVINHVSNVTGEVADLDAVAEIAKRHNIYLVVDASQSAGNIPIDMSRTGIDILVFTGHKSLYGPTGTGGIVINSDILLDTFKVGGSGVLSFSREQPEEYPVRLEAGTLNACGIAGLGAGIDFINETGIETIHKKEMRLLKRFYDGIKDIGNVKTYIDEALLDCSSENIAHGSILSLNIEGLSSGEAADILGEDYDIAVRGGAHCAPLMHEAMQTYEEGAVRFSFSYFNTEEEIDEAIKAVREIAGEV